MKKNLKMSLIVLSPIILFLIYAIVCIVYAKITYYEPDPIEPIYANEHAPVIDTNEFSTMIWNIGYCGLGAKSDFFYDGGKMMRPVASEVQKNLNGVLSELALHPTDFLLLQEVDSLSKRSYDTPEKDRIESHFGKEFKSHFALNYNVRYIPKPWFEPMGHVKSGLQTISKYEPKKVERHQLPGAFDILKQLFFLRRCLLVNYYPLSNGKELVVVNIHNSAYDDSGKLKKQEMDYLKSFLSKQYELGNYIVCGGDWNQCPPDFQYAQLAKGKEGDYFQTNVDKDFMENWQWIYDSQTATNRKNNKAYDPNKTFVTLIDFFLVSPNIQALSCKGISNRVEYSDHQPVMMHYKLK